jgi:hypothetical protein
MVWDGEEQHYAISSEEAPWMVVAKHQSKKVYNEYYTYAKHRP